jgi:hypothetical protein
MKTIITTIMVLLISLTGLSQTYLVDQHFSNVAPTGWTSTSNVWNFARDETATGNYRNVYDATKYASRFSSAANGNSIYIYIPINFKKDSIYTITFYTKRACSVRVYTNELPNQNTLLTKDSTTNSNCSSNWNTWYQWSFTIQSTYTGAGYFQIGIKTVYGGPTSVYLDDLTIRESSPVNLPIELLSFYGKSHIYYNELRWVTISENNNDYFNIEKTRDGTYFYNISIIKGAGNSTQKLEYLFIDRDIEDGINYYVLKQTDYDGKFKYSDIISIDNRKEFSPTLIKVTNTLGQEVTGELKGVYIFHYSDGTTIKRIF